MERYTAGYSKVNSNFVIQNINESPNVNSAIYPAVCVLKNILMRGNPSNLSVFLKEKLGDVNNDVQIPLIDNALPYWKSTIKGYENSNDYPAVKFFYDIIPKYLKEYEYIQQLILPEAFISEIVETNNKKFVDQQVDFYLPQAKLVIEVGGIQHEKDQVVKKLDYERSEFLKRNGIEVIRIKADAIKRENKELQYGIDEIRNVLNRCYKSKFKEYETFYFTPYKYEEYATELKAAAVIRFQILILSLLEKEIIKLDEEEWQFNILERDVTGFANIAVEDLFIWLEAIIGLQKTVKFHRPNVVINTYDKSNFRFKDNALNIDFSIKRRWDDLNKAHKNKNIIFVRDDYYDEKNYYRVSTYKKALYQNVSAENDNDVNCFNIILKNIFGYDSFRAGQLKSIVNILHGRNTLAVLPTSAGKSLIYQFTAMILPTITIVVEPLVSLMKDQKDNLDVFNISHTAFINSTQFASEKGVVQKNLAKGMYQYVWISPERFQSEKFRLELEAVATDKVVSLIVIDEAHCLSEWGHDFRTSYLNLANTINKFCPGANVLCLTATASVNVQTDIRNEFDISREDIKSVSRFTRDELTFRIKNNEKKYDELKKLLEALNKNRNIFHLDNQNTNCGIIFTRNVTGTRGCYPLAKKLSDELNADVRWFSGTAPKDLDWDGKK